MSLAPRTALAGVARVRSRNGEIVLLGTLHDVPTPLNRAVEQIASTAVREGRLPGGTTPDQIWERARLDDHFSR